MAKCAKVTRTQEGNHGLGVESPSGYRVLRRLKISRDRHVGGERVF